jgi:hypothetical protein
MHCRADIPKNSGLESTERPLSYSVELTTSGTDFPWAILPTGQERRGGCGEVRADVVNENRSQ